MNSNRDKILIDPHRIRQTTWSLAGLAMVHAGEEEFNFMFTQLEDELPLVAPGAHIVVTDDLSEIFGMENRYHHLLLRILN